MTKRIKTVTVNSDTNSSRVCGKTALNDLIKEREQAGLPTDVDSIRAALRKTIEECESYVSPQCALEFDVDHMDGFIEPVGLGESSFFNVEVFPSIPTLDDAAARVRDSDTNKRISDTLSRLRTLGPHRKVMRPAKNWKSRIAELKEHFPNFLAVIDDVVEPYVALLARSKSRVPRLCPILIEGEPGIGKSKFVQELQAVLNTALLFVDMSTQTNGSSLCGSSIFWSNSSPGQLFSCLAWDTSQAKASGAPLVVLDEIDKVDTGSRYDPLASLYTLLEEETAKNFEDQSLPGVVIDASRVIFILIANDGSLLPSPILSRVQRYYIDPPTPSQQRQVLKRIFAGILGKLDMSFCDELCAEIIEDALLLSPRAAKVRLEISVAKALAADHFTLDFATWRSTNRTNAVAKNKIGFY